MRGSQLRLYILCYYILHNTIYTVVLNYVTLHLEALSSMKFGESATNSPQADRVTTPQLMRVYGALMWSLGKVIDTPEVSRVYIGTFWDEPLQNDEQRKLFESEENDLYTALAQMPRSAATRKLNDLIKRARLARVLAFLLNHLRNKMPSFMGKSKEQKRLIDNLPAVYQEIAKEKGLAMGDFPDPNMMKEKLEKMDFTKFPKLDKKTFGRCQANVFFH